MCKGSKNDLVNLFGDDKIFVMVVIANGGLRRKRMVRREHRAEQHAGFCADL